MIELPSIQVTSALTPFHPLHCQQDEVSLQELVLMIPNSNHLQVT